MKTRLPILSSPRSVLRLIVALVLASGYASTAAANNPSNVPSRNPLPSIKMTLANGRLSAEIVAAPLRRVIDEVGKRSGIEARWLGGAGEESVSTRFSDLPLPEAIARLLGSTSFLLVTSRDGGGRITIFGEGRSQGDLPQTEPLPDLAAPVAPTEDGSPGPLETLITTALDEPDRTERVRALDQLTSLAGEDPDAQVALEQLLNFAADDTVKEAAREALYAALERVQPQR